MYCSISTQKYFAQILIPIYFVFADKPDIRKVPLFSKAAADLGETAELICEASGVPNVTVAWLRAGGAYISNNDDNHNGKKFEFSTEMLDLLTFRSVMLVHNVTTKDYGAYECVARNTEGT